MFVSAFMFYMDLIVENANILHGPSSASIGITGGTIERITADNISDSASNRINAAGRLVTPTYVNPHIHLDQVFTADDYPNESGTFQEAFDTNRGIKESYTVEGITDRVGEALEVAALHGNTVMRGFADVDGHAGLTGVEALLDCAEEYNELVDMQVCAFAQEGLGEHLHPEGEELLREGIELGADIVGGIPWIEHTQSDMEDHVDTVFDIAMNHDADIHFLVDDTDTPTSRSLEYVAIKTLRENYEGRVTCSHARALAAYDDYHAERVIDLVSQADIHILSNAHIVMFLGAHRDMQPLRRGTTRVSELLNNGVNVAIAQDDASDMWYPFGINDMLELGWFMCHAAQFSSVSEIDTAYEMITTRAAQSMGIDSHDIAEGTAANLVILEADSVIEAFRTRADKRYVIKDGMVLAETETSQSLAGSPVDTLK